MTLLAVLLGAALGAPLRYLTDRFVQARHSTTLPWGTFAVNMAGSFVLGAVVGAQPAGWWAALVGPGFCGALTTYSTFGYESVRLVEDGAHLQAAATVVGSVGVGLGAAVLGVWVGTGLG